MLTEGTHKSLVLITEFWIDRYPFSPLTSDGNGDGNGKAAEEGNSSVEPSKYAFLIPFFSFSTLTSYQ
jgi:hypothetical protein